MLLWCHTTDAFRLKGAIASGKLILSKCQVFNEDLLYFFYGRPAFRRAEDDQLRLSARAPVVMVFHADLVVHGRRLYPFDSGAFHAKRYQKWMHEGMCLSDFELEAEAAAPRRHVSAFFGNSRNYLRLRARRPQVPFAGEFEVESLVALLEDPESVSADDRRLALEMQLAEEVPFDASSVCAILAPDELLEAPWLNDFLALNTSIEVVPYELELQRRAGHYQALLEQIVRELQARRGVL
jgi:hypothetical protein